MNSSGSSTIRRGFIEGIVLILGIVVAVVLLNLLAEESFIVLGLVVTALLALAWMAFSRGAWWFPVPAAVCFGGMIFVGFKIYAYELGLLFALFAVIPLVLIRQAGAFRHSFLPSSLVVLAGYLAARMGFDLYLGNMDGYSLGSILRVYVSGLWPLVFAIPFVFWGSTKRLAIVLWVMYIASLIRCVLGVVGLLLPQVLPTTGFSVVLPGLYTEGIELRASGIWLLYMALSAWSMSGRRYHWVHSLMVVFAVFCVVMGGSRGSLGVMVVLLAIWMCVERRFVMLGAISAVFLVLVVALNSSNSLIYEFPERLQRTLSILMVRSPFQDIHSMIEGSDEWHHQLAVMAISRWKNSPWSFLFGHRLIPIPEGLDPMAQAFYDLLKNAADLGYYEAGFWTVLAVTGLVGGILYGITLWKLARPLWGWVWRDKVRGASTAFGFIALSSLFLWVISGWILGHFPSEQIVLLLIARAAYEDQKTNTVQVDLT